MQLLEALKERILIADGAMGTQLTALGFDRVPYSLANLDAPELVACAHEQFLEAGAEAIETNTFWANKVRFKLHGADVDAAEVCRAGARIARKAAGGRYVLGAISPCGKPLAPLGAVDLKEAEDAFVVQTRVMAEEGIDAIILESFSDLQELEVAIRAVRSATDLPIIACKSFIEDGETLAEGFPLRVAKMMIEWGADVVGANCVVGPQRMYDIVRWMSEVGDVPIIAMPTPGMPQLVKRAPIYDVTPEYFGKAAARLADAGANLIGGCCGVLPNHIRELASALHDRAPRKRVHVRAQEAEVRKPLEESEPSKLNEKLRAGKFVTTVELDLPRGLDTSKVLEGAAALHGVGCDLIDISDGARARLRMSPVAISSIIQKEVGIEVMMHVACRDRNLLALQSDMLGAHALGLRNILPITGDPATIGDFPSATSVFDIDSIGMVCVLSRFNEGRDMAGNTLGAKCAFTIAVAFNPVAQDFKFESDRLQRKADAGAHLIYTQPIFEGRHLDLSVESAKKVGLPILIGVLPLRSARHAEFMHNEVPGIVVPDWLRKKMADTPDESAQEVGIAVAQEFAAKLRKVADGLYLMPPFGNHKVAIRVMEAIER